jgi:polysaccharide pyruvyl transferase CsaB
MRFARKTGQVRQVVSDIMGLNRMSETKNEKSGRSGILICGAYGHGNAGDDAILEAIIEEMRSIDPDMTISVLSRRPEETRRVHGVRAIHTFNFPAFLRVMLKTKLYLNGGGSLIQDVTSRRSLWYYLFTIAAAKLLGNRVIMYGCGIGPVIRRNDRRITKFVLNRYVDIITLREDNSQNELKEYGVTRPEIVLASDPALTIPPAADSEVDAEFQRHGIDPNGKYICFALRRWPGFFEKAVHFADAAKYAYDKYGLTPVFLSINHRNDGEAADWVAKKLDIPYHILREPMRPSMTIGIMSRMSAVVSMRLHGLIFASGRGIPLVGISYDPKVTAFLDYIGQKLYLELEDVDSDRLRSLVSSALASSEEKARLLIQARRLSSIEKRNTECARKLLSMD